MKTLNMTPNDDRAQKMNIYQWLWCYHNIVEDEKEEQELFKNQLDRLAFIVNPEVARNVFDYEQKNKAGKNKVKHKKEDLFKNDEFSIETRAAMLGYDPDSGITAQEFLDQYQKEKAQSTILNEDIDSLIENMEELEEQEKPTEFGDPNEDPDDFFDRAMYFEDQFLNEGKMELEVDDESIGEMLDIFEVDDE